MSLKKAWVALALAAMVAPAVAADPFKLKIDETVTLKLTSPANSVVIGNATVADVAVHDPLTLLITGKAFGSTNLIVLDRAGRTIYTNQLAVADSANDDITIIRAGGSYTYSCIDKCRATPTVGDAPNHFSETMSTVTGKDASAQGSGH